MSGGSKFSDEKPKKPHLVFPDKGGVAGEVGDLRRDLKGAFANVDECLLNLIQVFENNNFLLSGEIKFNFLGAGVTASVDGADPNKINISIPGLSGSGAVKAIHIDALNTADMAVGRAAYVSANNKVNHTDARIYEKSIALGLYEGNSGELVTAGTVNAKFSDNSPMPAPGNRVFLARADDEPSDAAAGKLTITSPVGPSFIVEVGIVTYVNAVTYMTTKTASVYWRVQKMMRRIA